MRIDISSAIMAITTKSSINVKPFCLSTTLTLLFQRDTIIFAGMFVCHNYNIISRRKASYWLFFDLGRLIHLKTSLSFEWPVRRFKLKAKRWYVRFHK